MCAAFLIKGRGVACFGLDEFALVLKLGVFLQLVERINEFVPVQIDDIDIPEFVLVNSKNKFPSCLLVGKSIFQCWCRIKHFRYFEHECQRYSKIHKDKRDERNDCTVLWIPVEYIFRGFRLVKVETKYSVPFWRYCRDIKLFLSGLMRSRQ